MKKVWSWLLIMVFFASEVAFAIATAPFVSNGNNNFLGGILHGQYTQDFKNNTAGTIGLEAGPRNYRASGTWGWTINPCNRIKITGEYLTQDIDYNFFSGVTRQWVNQSAVGLAYQYAFNDLFRNYFDLSGYYSHAPSKNLNPITGNFTNAAGTSISYSDIRRIAGSNAGGISPGVTLHPWFGAEAKVILNYDDVVYDNVYSSRQKAQGFGGTVGLTQALNRNWQISATAANRAPFNYYQAGVDWVMPCPTTKLLVGLFGEYTQGKKTLPNTSLVGLNLTYIVDAPAPRVSGIQPQSFFDWMADPAVRMPQVLAIADESVTQVAAVPACIPPAISAAIPSPQIVDLGTSYSFNTAPFFSGSNLTFSGSDTAGELTISPSGIVSGTVTSTTVVTVIATNSCGSARQTYVITISNKK